MKDFFLFVKILLWEFIIVKNGIINTIMIALLYVLHIRQFYEMFWSLVAGLISFNLIQGYSEYIKERRWRRIIDYIHQEILSFGATLWISIECHNFPITHPYEHDHFSIDQEYENNTIQAKNKRKKKKFYNKSEIEKFDAYIEILKKIRKANTLSVKRIEYVKFIDNLKLMLPRVEQIQTLVLGMNPENWELIRCLQTLILEANHLIRYSYMTGYVESSEAILIDIDRLLNTYRNILFEIKIRIPLYPMI